MNDLHISWFAVKFDSSTSGNLLCEEVLTVLRDKFNIYELYGSAITEVILTHYVA